MDPDKAGPVYAVALTVLLTPAAAMVLAKATPGPWWWLASLVAVCAIVAVSGWRLGVAQWCGFEDWVRAEVRGENR